MGNQGINSILNLFCQSDILLKGIVVITSFTYAVLMINASVDDWTKKPVVTSIDTTAAPTKDIFFPSITACHEMPHHHESWELPTLIFNMFDFVNCGKDCKSKSVTKLLKGFENFISRIIDKHLKYDFGQDLQQLFYTKLENGQKLPGIFTLPSSDMYFDVVYCDLALVLEKKIVNENGYLANLIQRWKTSFIKLQPFSVDTLAAELGVEIDFESFTFWDNMFYGTCQVDYHVVMDFLGRLYYFNYDTIINDFGSSLRHLADHGNLQIMSRTAGPIHNDDGSWVSV